MATKSWKSEVFEYDSPEKLADLVVQFLNKNGIQPNEVVVVSSEVKGSWYAEFKTYRTILLVYR